MKPCKICKVEKDLSEYYKKKSGKNGLDAKCKDCIKEYYLINKERVLELKKIYYLENKENLCNKSLEYYYNNREIILENDRIFYNKEKMSIKNKEYYSNNKENISLKKKENYNREYNRDRVSLYRKNNKDIINEKIRLRKQSDPLYKAKLAIRSTISCSIRNQGYKKNGRTYEILCCTYEYFKEHIERQFTDGMSWDNYGEWHLDHKTPISWATTEEEVYELNKYENFQPLWASENCSKGNRYSH